MFRVGDKVIKSRPFSPSTYCRYGGDPTDVPLGTIGKILEIFGREKIYVQFPNCNWEVSPNEIDLIEEYKFNWKSLLEPA